VGVENVFQFLFGAEFPFLLGVEHQHILNDLSSHFFLMVEKDVVEGGAMAPEEEALQLAYFNHH